MSLDNIRDLLRCPVCKNDHLTFFSDEDEWAQCPHCGVPYKRISGIPFLITPEFLELLQNADRNFMHELPLNDKVKLANALYHNKFADQYDLSTYAFCHPGNNHQRRVNDVLRQVANGSHRGLLLDICCGTGNILETAQSYFDTCLGIDISVNMMCAAREKSFDVLGADATNIPVKDNSFDCVTAFSALHHIPDYPAAVREMGRVLKPGGTFFSDYDPNRNILRSGWAVSTPVKLFDSIRSARLRTVMPRSEEQHLAEFHHSSETGFHGELAAEALKDAGFSNVKVIYHSNPPTFDSANRWDMYTWGIALLKTVSFIPPTPRNVLRLVAIWAIK